MPRRPRNHVLEDLARAQIIHAFSTHGWVVEEINKDYGEDFLVRIFDNQKSTPWSFYVQSKSTDSISKLINKDGTKILYRMKIDHISHWQQFWEPVIVIIFDAENGKMYWESIQEAFPENPKSNNNKSSSISVPIINVLDADGIKRIRNRTKSRFGRFEQQKQGGEILINAIKERYGLEIDYSPENGIITFPIGKFIEEPNAGKYITFFGKIAIKLDKLAERRGTDVQTAFIDQLEEMLELLKSKDRKAVKEMFARQDRAIELEDD